MCTDVWVLMVASPYVEMLHQMSSEAAALRNVGLADEDDRHTRRVAALAAFEESDGISKVHRHDESILDRREFEYVVIGGAGQLHVVDRHGTMAQLDEPLGHGAREHLVQQPPHEEKQAFTAIYALAQLFCGQVVGDSIVHLARIGPIEVDGQSDVWWRKLEFVGQCPYAPFILARHLLEDPDDLPDIGTAYDCRPPACGSIPVNDAWKATGLQALIENGRDQRRCRRPRRGGLVVETFEKLLRKAETMSDEAWVNFCSASALHGSAL